MREIDGDVMVYWNEFNTEYYNDGVFKIGKQDKCFINLTRTKPSNCLISDKYHENDNAYLYVDRDNHVHFYCRRGCRTRAGKKSIMISKRKEIPICFMDKKIPKF